jgi:hypothetical protein
MGKKLEVGIMQIILKQNSKKLLLKDQRGSPFFTYLSQKYTKSTIDNKCKGKHQSSFGGQCILSSEEEIKITENIILACKWGFPLTSFDIRLLVKAYLDKIGRKVKKLKNNIPGKIGVLLS